MNKEIVFGFHAVEAVLKATPERILQLYRQEGQDSRRVQAIVQRAENLKIPIKATSKLRLEAWAGGERHQGLLAEIRSISDKTEKDLLGFLTQSHERPPLLLVLDGLQDPHNLGACLRSANAAGVDAVVLTRDRSVGITPVVRKTAAGATEVTSVITVANLANTLRQLKRAGLWVYGLDGQAKQSIYASDLKGPVGLVLGAEGRGLRQLTKELCDGLLSIPLQGTVESLNVSVAAGIALFEVLRQRREG